MLERLYSFLDGWNGGWSECGRGDYLLLAVLGTAIVSIGLALSCSSSI